MHGDVGHSGSHPGFNSNGQIPLESSTLRLIKELLPIVFATAVWGQHWENKKSVLCRCNNEAVVHITNTGTSKDPIV